MTGARQMYLKYGPETLAECAFCQQDDEITYMLYYVPSNILLPHLQNLIILGIATSDTICGFEANRWRSKAVLGALGLAAIDILLLVNSQPNIASNMPSPRGQFWLSALLRPLAICLFDTLIAFCIYATSTNLLPFLISSPDQNGDATRRQQGEALTQSAVSLQMTHTKLRALAVSRKAVIHDDALRAREDEYWQAVTRMEDIQRGDKPIWEDEEVQAAMERSLGRGSMNIEGVRHDFDAFIDNVTRNLER